MCVAWNGNPKAKLIAYFIPFSRSINHKKFFTASRSYEFTILLIDQ